MRQIANVAIFYVCSVTLLAGQLPAAESPDPGLKNAQTRLDVLEEDIQDLESRLNRSMGGAIVFLFGAFCALWALNTNRNPWLWFFAGVFFHVITVLVLLDKDARDKRVARGEPEGGAISTGVVLAIILALILVPLIAVWFLGGG